MRICLVTTEYPPAIGGMGQAACRIARGLARFTHHDVHVLWLDLWLKHDRHLRARSGSPEHGTASPSCRAPAVHYIEPTRWDYKNPYRAYYQHLSSLDAQLQFDAFVAFGVSYSAFPVVLRARERDIPAIVSMHGSDLQRDVFRTEMFSHMYWSLANATRVVSVNQGALQMAHTICDLDGRGMVIPNHIVPEDFEQGTTAIVPLHPDTLILAMAATFTHNKGLHFLLEAASQLRDLHLSVLLIGDAQIEDASYLDHELARFRDRLPIVTVGVVPHRAMLSYLRLANIFVLPSLSEGAPNVLLEAMLAGVSIVASDVGAVRHTIEDEVSGLIVPPGAVEELAAALSRLAADPSLRSRLARSASERVSTHFSPLQEAAAWDAVFQFGEE